MRVRFIDRQGRHEEWAFKDIPEPLPPEWNIPVETDVLLDLDLNSFPPMPSMRRRVYRKQRYEWPDGHQEWVYVFDLEVG